MGTLTAKLLGAMFFLINENYPTGNQENYTLAQHI